MDRRILTFSSRMVDPLNMRPDDVCIEDIAHSLSNQCRFTGHSSVFYSIAEHSVIGSRLVPPEHALTFLLHDAAEAYLCDVAAPLRGFVSFGGALEMDRSFDAVERETWDLAIVPVFNVPPMPLAQVIKHVDRAMLVREGLELLPVGFDWRSYGPPADTQLEFWGPLQAREAFLARFEVLHG